MNTMHRLFLMAAALSASAIATAQTRAVNVNGVWLSDPQLAQLDRIGCVQIPNGAYWLNTRTGAWGYAGDARVSGVLGQACGSTHRPGLSERGRLYRPGEIINGR